MGDIEITPQGPYSLAESVGFGFGQRRGSTGAVMRLAFCRDDYGGQAGVVLRQDPDGVVHGEVHGDGDPAGVRAQVARMLSLDVDATGFAEVGARDPVVARLQAAAPGLRPPLFHSPWEAAVWAVLSLRRGGDQARAARDRLAAALGTTYDLDGERLPAFPTPQQVLAADELPGVDPVRTGRLRGVAEAALDGRLDPGSLAALPEAEAIARLRTVPGLGPFFAGLVLIRATGVRDVLPATEPRLMALVGDLYELGGPATAGQLAGIAEAWSPWRTWVAVTIRAAASRL